MTLKTLFATRIQKLYIKQLKDIRNLIKVYNEQSRSHDQKGQSQLFFSMELDKVMSEIKEMILKDKNMTAKIIDESRIRQNIFTTIINCVNYKLDSGIHNPYGLGVTYQGQALYTILNTTITLSEKNEVKNRSKLTSKKSKGISPDDRAKAVMLLLEVAAAKKKAVPLFLKK